MQQLLFFIEKYKYFLLFVLLEIVGLLFTVQSRAYHKSQFINSANSLTGGLYDISSSFDEYFSLKTENKKLAEENIRLRNALEKNTVVKPTEVVDSVRQNFHFISAKVINNNFTKRNNVLTINKGSSDGLTIDMGVIDSKGIIGVVNKVSQNYATVLSVLNSKSKINAKIHKTHYFGTLSWNGNDYKVAQLNDIQSQAPVQKGDTIVSGGKSILFPEGIPIGTIKSFTFENKQFQNIEIDLFTDMSSLGYVHIIKNNFSQEIEELENNND